MVPAPARALDGKVALVTGSTSGIGLGIARALAASGADVVLNGFGAAEEIARARDAIEADHGVKARYSAADMSSPDAIGEMVAATLADFGRLDILVNNAGIQHVAPLERFPVAKWDQILAINLSAAFHSTQPPCPRCAGRIRPHHQCRVRTWFGRLPFQGSLRRRQARNCRPHQGCGTGDRRGRITCNAICPGYVYTPLVETQIDGQAKAHGISRDQVIRDVLLAQQPNKRFATVEEIGALTVFLASEAAASITGIALPVDGGWTAH